MDPPECVHVHAEREYGGDRNTRCKKCVEKACIIFPRVC